jgi:Leucine-rich repeat (LRR) protein
MSFLGCVSRPPPAVVELDFPHQSALVRAGESDEIRLERQWFGDQEFAALAGLKNLRTLIIDDDTAFLSPRALAAFSNLPALEHFRFRGGGLNDVALTQIARAKSLRILNLPHAEFTDVGLTWLKELPQLEQLRFGSPHVTDAGMQTLAELPSLKRLHLIDVPITDAGLARLAGIQQLESLYIDGSNISDSAFDDLFRRRPTLHVHLNQRHHDHDPNKHTHP